MTRKPNILMSGMIAGDPGQGGAAWAVLQYVLGFKRLGHAVHFVEPVHKPATASDTDSKDATLRYFKRIVDDFDLQNDAALLWQGTRETFGLSYETLCRRSRETDLVINISGMLTDENLIGPIPRRVYLDLDPAFIQLWHTQGIDMRLDAHTHFVTVGLELGSPRCHLPDCGRSWIKTVQPIVLSLWPRAEFTVEPALVAIGNWRGYGSIEHQGKLYGQKAHSVRSLIELPGRASVPCRLAIAIHPQEKGDLDALSRFGWKLLDPAKLTYWPADYQQLVQSSWAELGIAKSGYVQARCGWFSDRSICFLASGRPVVAQETGFSHHLPTGRGLLKFSTVEEIAAAVDALLSDYAAHSHAARNLAESIFDSNRVLPRLLEEVGAK